MTLSEDQVGTLYHFDPHIIVLSTKPRNFIKVMDKELLTIDDVKLLVDTFYTKVKDDALLAPIFNARIENRWPHHLEKMYTFWQTTLLGEHTYYGSPFPPHAQLPVDGSHFKQWISLFTQTVDELFTGDKAVEAKWRAGKMAEMFELKINHFRNNFKAIQ